MLMLMRRTSACKTSAGRSHIVRWLTAFLGPNLTPFLGPNLDPKKGSRIRSHFHFFFDVFAWAPFWGLDLDPKMESTIGEFGHGLQMLSPLICDAFRMSMTINTCFFSLWVPLFCAYSGGPFMAAMFLVVFWTRFWGSWCSRFFARHTSLCLPWIADVEVRNMPWFSSCAQHVFICFDFLV